MRVEGILSELWLSNFSNQEGFYSQEKLNDIVGEIKSIISYFVILDSRHTVSDKSVHNKLHTMNRIEQDKTVCLRVVFSIKKSLFIDIDYDGFFRSIKEKFSFFMKEISIFAEKNKKSGVDDICIIFSNQIGSGYFIDPVLGQIKVSSPADEKLIISALTLLSEMPTKTTISDTRVKTAPPIATALDLKVRLQKKENHKYEQKSIIFKGKIDAFNDAESSIRVEHKYPDGTKRNIIAKTKTPANYNSAREFFCTKEDVLIKIVRTDTEVFAIDYIEPLYAKMGI